MIGRERPEVHHHIQQLGRGAAFLDGRDVEIGLVVRVSASDLELGVVHGRERGIGRPATVGRLVRLQERE